MGEETICHKQTLPIPIHLYIHLPTIVPLLAYKTDALKSVIFCFSVTTRILEQSSKALPHFTATKFLSVMSESLKQNWIL